MKKIVAITFLLALLSACADNQEPLKSPCVGAAGSPCEHRAPVMNPA